MLFNTSHQEEIRVATVDGQKLINFDIETTNKTQRRGNVYKGIITRIEQSLEACFVDYGTEKQGFLPFKEISSTYVPESGNGKYRDFSKLTTGTEIIVQVEKDERGNKGAALTTYTSLPGRYLVLMPNNSRSGGVSRRINGDERNELKEILSSLNIPQGMSIIARTAALGRVHEELQWDLNYLLKLWDAIISASEQTSGSFLIYQESNLVVRSIRDHFSPDISEILIDKHEIFEQAQQFMSHVMPNFVNKIKFYSDATPLFSRFQIEHQIQSAYGRIVVLPSGGSIAIDYTEALTAIDVNSAKSNKGIDIEATAFATNLEAAEEIARQMRLRDLGGLVVIDFIDMESQKNQRDLENLFKEQLGFDRARIQMGKLSKFGLLELSRQRLQTSLEESTTITCPRCSGIGTIRGIESTAVHILRIIEEEAVKNSHYLAALHIQLPVSVATYLLNEKRANVVKIEERMKVQIVLIPNIHLDSPHYKIKKITNNSELKTEKLSYDLVETPEESHLEYQVTDKKSGHKAVVKNIIPNQPAPSIKNHSIIQNILTKIASLFKTTKSDSKAVEKYTKIHKFNKKQHSSLNKNNVNKIRPVIVNKSNNKIQTIKPNNNNKINTKSIISEIQSINKLHTVQDNNLESNNNNNRVNTQRKSNNNFQKGHNANDNSNLTSSIMNQTAEKVKFTRSNNYIKPTKVDSNSNSINVNIKNDFINNRNSNSNNLLGNEINKSWKKPQINNNDNISIIKKSNSDLSINNNHLSEILKSNESIAEIAQEKPKDPIKNSTTQKPTIKNTILNKVDLGNLELISTNPNLSIVNESELTINIDKFYKRYNDLPKIENSNIIDIEYELVETKVN